MTDEIRALTVRQPMAGFIAHLGKRVENRAWQLPERYRGARVAIHAAAAVEPGLIPATPGGAGDWASLFASRAEWDAWRLWHLGCKPRDVANWPPKLALGAVVAVATIVGCHRFTCATMCGPAGEMNHTGLCSPWARLEPWHWELADVRALPEPVPCRGKLSLWRLPADAENAVRAQLEETHG
jgi:hypothetical protein